VAAELERRWEVALRTLAEAREAAEDFARRPMEPDLEPGVRAQLRDLGAHLPELWASGRLQPEHQKELLRTLIRRVILTRPAPAQIDVKVVWVSGAVTPLVVHPLASRTPEMADYEQVLGRIRALSLEGESDQVIADHLNAEGFRSARQFPVSAELVGKIRRAHGIVGVRQQFHAQEHIGEDWTIHGLAHALQVHNRWLYDRIAKGTLPARRHPKTGHFVIPHDTQVLSSLQAERDTLRRS
jgi:hypothetical protein